MLACRRFKSSVKGVFKVDISCTADRQAFCVWDSHLLGGEQRQGKSGGRDRNEILHLMFYVHVISDLLDPVLHILCLILL